VNKGRIVFDGGPGDLSPQRIAEIYGTEAPVPRARYAS